MNRNLFFFFGVLIASILLTTGCKSLFNSTNEYIETNSGLKYSIIKRGEGDNPKRGDIVSIHYTGKYEDGNVFDKSRDRNNPVSFRLGSKYFIKGLEEGIALMNVGGHYRFIIPPDLAYGKEQVGVINPNSTLIYDVELLDVKPGVEITDVEKNEIEKITTESGLTYSIISEGKGKRAFSGLIVKAEYTGFYDEGIIFDSSLENEELLVSKLGDGTLIDGLEEAFTYLREGDKARLWIPAELAYGDEGRGIIPPGTDLIFDVELIEVKEPNKPEPFNVDGKDTLETESGLQYIVVNPGYGPHPEPGQLVNVHYSAYLLNGFMFDSSVQRSQPLSIVAGKGLMINGWEEGILLMRKNAKFRFIIPSYLAFGKKSFEEIPAFATVVFDIELIDIE